MTDELPAMTPDGKIRIKDPHVAEFGTDHPRGYPPPGVILVRPKMALEAVQLTGDADWRVIAEWCGGEFHPWVPPDGDPPWVWVPAPLGREHAAEGDWVVKGARAFEVLGAEELAATYEPATVSDEPVPEPPMPEGEWARVDDRVTE